MLAEPIKVAAAKQFTPVNANHVGTRTCLFCHARQAELFGKTLMGRIDMTHPGKLDCESCHGPGSSHIRSVGCASCHGEGQKGMGEVPRLAGLQPLYVARQLFDMQHGSSARWRITRKRSAST